MQKKHNIALFSAQKRKEIELEKQAAKLIHDYKQRRISRADIITEIDKVEDGFQLFFKAALNKFKGARNG